MKKIIAFWLIAVLGLTANAHPKAKRVVMIALDGISVEGFTKAATPNLDALLAEGSLSVSTRVVMPSVTLPNWTSHLTGSGPEQHGVDKNNWRTDNFVLPAIEKDADGYYPSLWKVLKENVVDCKLAYYYNWKELINSMNPRYMDEVGFEQNDGYMENYRKAFDFICANKDKPTVAFLYSVHTDHAGHNHGWMSSEFIQSIEEVDKHIGDFLKKMKDEGLYESTHFMFLSDHGGIRRGHGGMTTNEMVVPWGIVGKGIKKGFNITEPNNTVNTAATILYLFKVKQPDAWIGEVPYSIFK